MLHQEIIDQMIRHEAGGERSLQRKIGPSSIGEDCWHCLGAQIAQLPTPEDHTFDWARIKGHALHAHMQALMEEYNRSLGGQRFLLEQRVTAGRIGNDTLDGTADLFDMKTGVVCDYKFPAERSMSEVRRRVIKPTYKVQPHVYGLGFENAGHEVTGTLLLFFPVASSKLSDAIPHYQPYDRQIALNAIATAQHIWELLQRDGVEKCLPRLKRKAGCDNCLRYSI